MLLNDICVFVDPMAILSDQDKELLIDTSNYESKWKSIKEKHNVDTNRTVKDIHLFDVSDIVFNGKKPLKNIPDTIHTDSGYLVGIEFKDLKKLNPHIAEENLRDAFIIKCVHIGCAMSNDLSGEYLTGGITFRNENYDPNDENSHQNVTYDIEWINPNAESEIDCEI